MARDTIIDPEWEAEELRREAEREARRRPKRIPHRFREVESVDGEGTIAPWDDPPEGSDEVWLTDGPDETGRDEDAQDDTERASRPRRDRTTHDEKVHAEHAADGDANADGGGGEPKDPPPPRKPSKLKEYIGSVLSGNILSKGEVRRLYPYLLFVAFLMLLYISNVFRMQQLHRRQETLSRQVKELRAKSLTMSALRMNSTRQSEIIKELRRRGIALEESLEPPKVVK